MWTIDFEQVKSSTHTKSCPTRVPDTERADGAAPGGAWAFLGERMQRRRRGFGCTPVSTIPGHPLATCISGDFSLYRLCEIAVVHNNISTQHNMSHLHYEWSIKRARARISCTLWTSKRDSAPNLGRPLLHSVGKLPPSASATPARSHTHTQLSAYASAEAQLLKSFCPTVAAMGPLFTCGEADRSGRDKFSSFFLLWRWKKAPKQPKLMMLFLWQSSHEWEKSCSALTLYKARALTALTTLTAPTTLIRALLWLPWWGQVFYI